MIFSITRHFDRQTAATGSISWSGNLVLHCACRNSLCAFCRACTSAHSVNTDSTEFRRKVTSASSSGLQELPEFLAFDTVLRSSAGTHWLSTKANRAMFISPCFRILACRGVSLCGSFALSHRFLTRLMTKSLYFNIDPVVRFCDLDSPVFEQFAVLCGDGCTSSSSESSPITGMPTFCIYPAIAGVCWRSLCGNSLTPHPATYASTPNLCRNCDPTFRKGWPGMTSLFAIFVSTFASSTGSSQSSIYAKWSLCNQ